MKRTARIFSLLALTTLPASAETDVSPVHLNTLTGHGVAVGEIEFDTLKSQPSLISVFINNERMFPGDSPAIVVDCDDVLRSTDAQVSQMVRAKVEHVVNRWSKFAPDARAPLMEQLQRNERYYGPTIRPFCMTIS